VRGAEGYEPPAADGDRVQVEIGRERAPADPPAVSRLDGQDFLGLRSWSRPRAKTTTDHNLARGPVALYRGHSTASATNVPRRVNAFTGETGKGLNLLTGERGVPFAKIARDYKPGASAGW